MADLAPLHAISRSHLDVLSTELGIMQHAIGSVPDPKHGYCTDDVARALRVDLLHRRTLGWPAIASSAWRNVRFLEAAFDARTGRFRNFRTMSGHWIYAAASEDSQGRAMLALGQTIAADPDRPMVVLHRSIGAAALALWDRALPRARTVTALRARASIILGCVARLEAGDDIATAEVLDELAGQLQHVFDDNATSDWPWPEPVLTYENGLLPRALIVAGRHAGNRSMVDTGLLALHWLLRVQTASAGYFSPIGNEWWPRGGVRSGFDQQPIEATALLLAAETAFAATGAQVYRDAMELAYGWFLGANELGLWVADPIRGSGSDGLTPRGLNTNEGAESTLMWLTAAEHIRAMRHAASLAETAVAASATLAAAPVDDQLPRMLPQDPSQRPVAAAIR